MRVATATAGLTIVAMACGANAAETSDSDKLEEVVVTARLARQTDLGLFGERSTLDTPFSITSYTAQLLQDQGVTHIADILQNDPTTHANASTSTGADDFSIRGFYISNSDILFNGLPGVAPSFFNSMLAEGIERVDVIKGPSALVNGAAPGASVGGSINLIPKRAGDRPTRQFTGSFSGDSVLGGHVDVGQRFGADGQVGVRFNGVLREGDTAVDRQSIESQLFTLAADYRGERLNASVDLGYQEQRIDGIRDFSFVDSSFSVPEAPDAGINYDGPNDFSHPRVFYGMFRARYEVNDQWSLYGSYGGSERRTKYIFALRFISAPDGTLAGETDCSWCVAADHMYARSREAGIQGRFATGSIEHQVIVGYSRYDQDWRRAYGGLLDISPSNIYRPVFDPAPPSSILADPDDAVRANPATLSGIAVADTMSMLDDRFQLTLGVRQQNIETGAVDLGSYYDEDKLTKMVGVLGKPWGRNISVYANYMEGLEQGPNAPPGSANEGQVFAPVVTKQYELGAKAEFPRFTANVALFQIAHPNGITDPITDVFGINGEQRHRGVDLNFFGVVADGVRLLGGVGLIDAELTDTEGGLFEGNTGIGVPEVRVVLGAEWDTPLLEGLTLRAQGVRNGSQYLDQANDQAIPSWTRLDVGARYRFERADGKSVWLRLNVDNVLDESYWDTNIYSQLTLGDPRSVSLAATFDF